MDSFALNLSSSIINLEYLKKKVLENKKTASKLCFCRQAMLDNYTSVMQTYLVKSSTRILKYLEDGNDEYLLHMQDLRDWYYKEAYDKLYDNIKISNKMVLLYRVLQELLDSAFHEQVKEIFIEVVELKHSDAPEEVFSCVINKLFNRIRNWYEAFTLNAISIRVDCRSIVDEIFDVYDVPKDVPYCDSADACSTCAYLSAEKHCMLHEHVLATGEKVNLILTEEMLKAHGWIESFFAIFNEFHVDPKNVTLYCDYQLFDEHKTLDYAADNIRRLRLAKQIFKDVKVINSDYVNFGSFYGDAEEFIES